MEKNSKKKILFVDHDIGLSGSTISMCYIIEEFIKNGFFVLVLTKNNKKGKEELIKSGAKIIEYSASPFKSITLSLHFSDKTNILSIKWFKNLFKDVFRFINGMILSIKIINEYKPNLIYINEYVTIQVAIFAKLKSIPVFVHIRSMFITQEYNFRIMLLKKALKIIPSYIFPISEIEAKQIGAINNLKAKVEVIPEFLNEKDFEFQENILEIKRLFNVSGSNLIVTFLGGIKYIKGSIDFISAIGIVTKEFKDVKFILAGKIDKQNISPSLSQYYNQCKSLIKNSNLNSNLSVIGEITNIKELIGISDIIVSCSVETHFSRPIIEAWAQKKSVIATDILHSKNLIEDGIDGLIIPKSNPKKLASTLNELLKNDSLRLKLGKNGYKKAKEYFCNKRNRIKIVNYCSEILNK